MDEGAERRTKCSESFSLWDATFLHNPWHQGPEARWMPCAPLSRRRHKHIRWRRRRHTSPAGTVSQPIGKPFNGQAKGLLWLTWRSYAGPPQYYITPEGGSPEPACKAKPITGRTLGAQGQRPGGAINPHAHQGVSTFGNTGKHRPGPRSRSRSRPRREAPEPSSPGSQRPRQPHINIFKFLVVFFFFIVYNDIRNVSYSGKQNFPFDRKRIFLFRERI